MLLDLSHLHDGLKCSCYWKKNQFSYLPNLHRRIQIQGSNSLSLRYRLERHFSASSLFSCSSLKAQEDDPYRQIHGNIYSNKCSLISLSCISLYLHTQAHVYVWKKKKKTLPEKSWAPGWHHLWAAAMVMSDMLEPEDSTLCFACCFFCCHAAAAPTTPEEGVYCITSFANKNYSVVLAAQMVCKAFSRLLGAVRTGLRTKRPVS